MPDVVVLLPPPMQKRGLQLMLARTREIDSQGESVALAYCAEKRGTCASNLSGNPLVCSACRHSSRKTAEATGLPSLPLVGLESAYTGTEEQESLSYSEASEIVCGIQSCLITVLRVMTADLNRVPELKRIKRRYLGTATGIYRRLKELCQRQSVQRVEVLNGRYACAKIGILAAEQLGIAYNTLDFSTFGRPMVFRGHTPHDRLAVQSRIVQNEPDLDVAADYFGARRDRSVNRFAAAHNSFEPPQLKSAGQKKVSFFLSSLDECESLGPGWRSVFRDNAAVIDAACRAYPDYFFTVRFHPNQASIVGDVIAPYRDIYHDNLRMYFPDDDVDTYQLIDWSDVVVTFASTVAIESCWQGKPVIELGPSYFDHLDVSYTPESLEAFLELLAEPLEAKSKAPAASFANYEVHGFDDLKSLRFTDGRMELLGSGRRAGLFAKIAKEVNNLVIRRLRNRSIELLAPERKCA